MNKKIVLSLAVAVLMAAPAFAAVQNVKVSGSIVSTYLNRSDFDFEKQSGQNWRQSVFLTQTVLRVDADLSDNVSTTIGLINERVWGPERNGAQNFDTNISTEVGVYLANVTLREFLYSPLTLTVGRQTFAFGNSFIFDATGTNNAATGPLGTVAQDLTLRSALDAVRATLDYKPLTIDLFYGKIDQNGVIGRPLGTNGHKDDNDVYGINTNYQLGDAMNTVVEAYLFGRNNHSTNVGASNNKTDRLWIPGLRASTNPIKGLNVQVEGAVQRGSAVTTDATTGAANRQAYGFQAMASYALPVAELEKYKPTISGSYTYVSGDRDFGLADNKNSAWDPFFENQAGGTIYNTLFNLSNLRILNATVSASPLADVTTSLSWNSLWTAQRNSTGTMTLIEPDGTNQVVAVNTNKQLGNEFDGSIVYQYTEDVKFGLTLGWFAPGNAFTVRNDAAAKQAIASVGVNF
jgi:hypothetical protein